MKTIQNRNRAELVLVAVLAVGASRTILAEAKPLAESRILVIHADNAFLPANRIMDERLSTAFVAAGVPTANIYSEYMEVGRFPDPGMQERFLALLGERYLGLDLDLIVVTDDPSLEYVAAYGERFLPPASPVLLCGLSDKKVIPPSIKGRCTGTLKTLDARRSLANIAALHPDLERLYIFAGSGPNDRVYLSYLADYLALERPPFEVVFLAERDLDATLERLARLPAGSAVLALSFYVDAAGHAYNPKDATLRAVGASSAPVYGITDSYVGTGFVGGNLISFAKLSDEAARLGLRILKGARVQDLPPRIFANLDYYDWKQLRRWGIPPSRVPDGSVVVNRPPAIWEEYRAEIAAYAAAFLLVAALCVALYVYLGRTKAAEARALALVAEKDELLHELHHRTKNNMQVISSLLRLYSRESRDESVKEVFGDMVRRIGAMAAVHEQLYRSRQLSRIDLAAYLRELGASLSASLDSELRRVAFEIDAEEAVVGVGTAIPFGMFVNELVSNSWKHGFAGEATGLIRLGLRREGVDALAFSYADSGRGLPEGFDLHRDGAVGFQTLLALSEGQLGGRFEILPGPGFACSLLFRPEEWRDGRRAAAR